MKPSPLMVFTRIKSLGGNTKWLFLRETAWCRINPVNFRTREEHIQELFCFERNALRIRGMYEGETNRNREADSG